MPRDPRKFRGRASLGGLGSLLGGAMGAGEVEADFVGDYGPTNTPTYRAKSPIADMIFNRGATGARAQEMNFDVDMLNRRNMFESGEAEKERGFRSGESEKERKARMEAESFRAQEDKNKALLDSALKQGITDPALLNQLNDPRIAALLAQAQQQKAMEEYILANQAQVNPVALQGRLGELFAPMAKNVQAMTTPIPQGGTVMLPPVPGYSDVTMAYDAPSIIDAEVGQDILGKPVMGKKRIPGTVRSMNVPLNEQQRDESIRKDIEAYNKSQVAPPAPDIPRGATGGWEDAPVPRAKANTNQIGELEIWLKKLLRGNGSVIP